MSGISRKDMAIPSKMGDNPKKRRRNVRTLLASPNTWEELLRIGREGAHGSGMPPRHRRHAPRPQCLDRIGRVSFHRMAAAQAKMATFVADGAAWIWKRLDWVVAQIKLNPYPGG